jgi:hypothetical protein
MSVALEEWQGPSARSLDEIESLRQQIGDLVVGGAEMIEQVDCAYAALIVAHFQRYCRAVHTEASNVLVSSEANPALGRVFGALLTEHRLLDRGNPTPGTLGRDFARFGLRLWAELEADDRRNRRRKEGLGQLCQWRNAITHGDIPRKRSAGQLVPHDLSLETCRDWRRALDGLATSIDAVVAKRCRILGCPKPW